MNAQLKEYETKIYTSAIMFDEIGLRDSGQG